MNILAYKEILERKEEELATVEDQLIRLRSSSMHIKKYKRPEPEIQMETTSGPTCGSSDCLIF